MKGYAEKGTRESKMNQGHSVKAARSVADYLTPIVRYQRTIEETCVRYNNTSGMGVYHKLITNNRNKANIHSLYDECCLSPCSEDICLPIISIVILNNCLCISRLEGT